MEQGANGLPAWAGCAQDGKSTCLGEVVGKTAG